MMPVLTRDTGDLPIYQTVHQEPIRKPRYPHGVLGRRQCRRAPRGEPVRASPWHRGRTGGDAPPEGFPDSHQECVGGFLYLG